MNVGRILSVQLDLSGSRAPYVPRHRLALTVDCPSCSAKRGQWCTSSGGWSTKFHVNRVELVDEMTDGQARAALDALEKERVGRRPA